MFFCSMQVTTIKVRIYHCDSYGHVNNARYLEFLEEARWNWLQPLIDNGAIDTSKYSFVLVNLCIAYRSPLVAGDIAEVKVGIPEFGNASMKLKQEIWNKSKDKIASEAEVSFVILNNETGRPIPITEEWKVKLKGLST